jgi:tetratricopeptide (TPR) repeat protein/predicted MPP superfamily phosphohydrolase
MRDDKANGFTILHISDAHFKCTDDPDSDDKFLTLYSLLSRLVEEKMAPAAVVFSGDVTWSGKKNEYMIAARFFDNVLKAVGIKDIGRLFVIPGNHDVDRRLIPPEHEKQLLTIRNDPYDDDPERFLESKDLLRPFLKKFRGYQTFSTTYLERRFDEDEYSYADSIDVGDLRIGIACFNSAWLVTKDEGDKAVKQGQLVGARLLLRTLSQLEGADFKIALLHHPWHWLVDSTQGNVKNALQGKADLVLCGHQVNPDIDPPFFRGEEKPCCYIQGGPLHNTEWPSRFQFIRFEIQGNEKIVTIIPYRYYGSREGWCGDPTLDKYYNKPIKLGKVNVSPEAVYPDLQALIDKTNCKVLKEETFSSPSGEQEILDFYCGSPLRWEIIAANGDIRRSLEEEVMNEAMQCLDDFRIVCVVAEPGAGKSTLAWRTAYQLFRMPEGNFILHSDNNNPDFWHKLPQLARYIGRHFYVLIDDIFQEREFVKALEKLLEKDRLPVTVLATARSSEFNTGGLDKRFIRRMDLRLDQEEKDSLLKRLGKSYETLDEDAQRDFRTTDLFLVLGMVLTKGESFERIIRSMIESLIKEDERNHDSSCALSFAFKFVGFSYSHGVSVPEKLLSNLHEERRLEGILDKKQVRGILYEDPRPGSKTRFVRAGHQIIAQEAVRLFKTEYGPFSPRVLYTNLLEATDENDQVQRSSIAHLTNAISVKGEEEAGVLDGVNIRNVKVLKLLNQATISELGLWRIIFKRLNQAEGTRKCSDEILLRSPLTTLDCQLLVSEHQSQNTGKAFPAMNLWLKNNPDDGIILSRYVHLTRETGDERQVEDAIARAAEWTPRHPEDTAVRQAYIALVNKKGTAEQREELIEKTALWLEEHPQANQIYQTFVELVRDRCEKEQRIKQTIRDASSWLKDHDENTNVRTVYLSLVGMKGFLEAEDIEHALVDTQNWMRKHGPNPVFKDYLAHLVKRVTKGSTGITVDPNLVKDLGYKSISSYDWKKDAEAIDGFARWLSYEGFFEESENIYRKLVLQNLYWRIKANVLFGYGMLFMSKAMNRPYERETYLGNLERAKTLFGEALDINGYHIEALAFLAISLREQGLFPEAAQAFKDAEGLSRKQTEMVGWTPGKLFFEIGKFYLEFGEYAEAKDWFAKALSEAQIFPHWWGSARAKIGIATNLKRQAKIKEARSLFSEALLELENALKHRPALFQLPASRDIPDQIAVCRREIAACNEAL